MKNDTTFLRHFLRHDIIRLRGGKTMLDVIEDVRNEFKVKLTDKFEEKAHNIKYYELIL